MLGGKKKNKVDFSKARRFKVACERGLASSQVQSRIYDGYVNYDSAVKTKSVARIIASHLMTLFNLVNIIIAIALVCVGSYKNVLFMLVISANILIGIIQEIRAKIATDKLSFVSRSITKVIRDGVTEEIADNEIVLDDLIVFKSGDQIPVDCIVMEGECEVNESFVTGESDSVFKGIDDTLLAGSFVSGGECKAKADKIADNSYISSISKSAKVIKGGSSVLMTSLKRVITALSIVIFPLGIMLFIQQYSITGQDIRLTIENTSASLLGMIPQGLILLTSSALALSVVKLSKRKVLVKDLYSVEMLARVDTVCLDKTGTLTEGKLNVEKLIIKDSSVNAETILSSLADALGKDNATMEAIGDAYSESCAYGLVKRIPFSSKTKWSGCMFDGLGSAVIGAAEYIMPSNKAILNEISRYSSDYRVLLLCVSKESMDFGVLPQNMKPAAFVLLRDRIRPEAPDLIEYLVSQDVDVRIISGDNPVTVSAIAKVCGVPNAHKYIDCSTLKNEKDIERAAREYKVFGRVTPFQKKQLVLAMKADKHTVAMTGDGVNDVLAMKEADCSIAMGSGTDAARNVSKLVLLQSDFDSLPYVIAEGRQSINNIQRSASFFLTKTVYATLLAFLFLFIARPYPFKPIQQSLISFACIGFPSIVLALEPNKSRIKGSFFGNVILRALPGGLTVAFAVTAMALFGGHGVYNSEIPTAVLYITGFVSFLELIGICFPPNKLGKALIIAVAAIFVGGCLIMPDLWDIEGLSAITWLIAGIICALSAICAYYLTRFSRRILYGKRLPVPEELYKYPEEPDENTERDVLTQGEQLDFDDLEETQDTEATEEPEAEEMPSLTRHEGNDSEEGIKRSLPKN